MASDNYESLILSTPATVWPVTANEIKTHLRISDTGTEEDVYITSLIKAATKKLEDHLGKAFITQSWTWVMDKTRTRLEVPYPPLQSITSIKCYDYDNTTETADSSTYHVMTNVEPGVILLANGSAWPDSRGKVSFEIIFVAGYGDAASDVPESIKHAIKLLVTKLYERRGDDINTLIMEADIQGWISNFIKMEL